MFEIEIVNLKGLKSIGTVSVTANTTLAQLKPEIEKLPKGLDVSRQSLRTEPKGKAPKDERTMQGLGLQAGSKIYVKDLGPQIGWKTVFLVEYAGPLIVYFWMYQRPWIFYGDVGLHRTFASQAALICWSGHYAKRLLETMFVHRFSHATMPLRNLFKNCAYYWLFTMYVGYYINHPFYMEPHFLQVGLGMFGFVVAELGNFSIHLALRDLRPLGTTTRKIPKPTQNPFTILFDFVSCPNYLFEFIAWGAFAFMTMCIPAAIFAAAGMYQMTVWAIAKHKAYKKEFLSYPQKRKAIIPFIL